MPRAFCGPMQSGRRSLALQTRPNYGNARFGVGDPSAAQILRLSATLPSPGQERLARLRGFGAGFGGALMCTCSRISLLDGTPAILIVATERAGPSLPLAERVRRLFADGADAVAAFTPDGTRLHANAAALQRLNGTTSLSALGIDALAARALRDGHANGVAYMGQIPFEVAALRLGKDESRVLALTWPTPPKTAAASTRIEPSSEPMHAAPAPEVDAPAPPAPPVAAATPAPSEPPAPGPAAASTNERADQTAQQWRQPQPSHRLHWTKLLRLHQSRSPNWLCPTCSLPAKPPRMKSRSRRTHPTRPSRRRRATAPLMTS